MATMCVLYCRFNTLPGSINAQHKPLCHSVPKTVHPNQSSDVKRNPKRLYGWRFTILNAISECFTRRFALRTVCCGDEASFYCWDQRFHHSYLHLSSPRGYKCSYLQLVGHPVDMIRTWFRESCKMIHTAQHFIVYIADTCFVLSSSRPTLE